MMRYGTVLHHNIIVLCCFFPADAAWCMQVWSSCSSWYRWPVLHPDGVTRNSGPIYGMWPHSVSYAQYVYLYSSLRTVVGLRS